MLIFTAVIVALLWLCQVVFFEDIYKSIRIREVESGAADIVDALGTNNRGSVIEEAAAEHGYCISVLQTSVGGTISPVYTNHQDRDCIIHSIDRSSFRSIYESTRKNGGKLLQRYTANPARREYYGDSGIFGGDRIPKSGVALVEGIIYSEIAEDLNGNSTLVLVNATISPVESTVRSMRSLLTFITAILVVFAVVLATVISHMVSNPIRKLTASAKRLASGDYDTHFPSTGYREARELSEALNFAQNELSRVDEVRRELIANVSHDLRTPLTMISGYGEVMRDIPGENTPENVQIIIDEANRLTELVNDVLDISHIESGLGKNEKTHFILTDTVKEALERFAKLCRKSGYNIEFYCDGDVTVYADRRRIVQALYNLVGNAINHIGEDKLVKVTQQTFANTVRISVSDTGEGIPKDKLPLIWDRYYKVDSVHKREIVGTGLGLSIVKNVMDMNGGKCGVFSEEGVGSTFYIELPTDIEKGKSDIL